MAKARMLSKRISGDAAVDKLSCDGARLLYTWMIAHADNLGRMPGEPGQVRNTVMPRRQDLTDQKIASWLAEMRELGLIHWFPHEGLRYIELKGWSKNQKLTTGMSKTSDYPDPSMNHRESRLEVEVEVELEGEVEREREVEGEGECKEEGALLGNDKPHPKNCTCEICFPSIWERFKLMQSH